MVGVGASAAVGYTDKGQINVAQIIADRNQQVQAGDIAGGAGQPDSVLIPVQNTNKAANGGLVGLGTGGTKKPTPAVDTVSSTATTTDATASSTAAVASSTSPTAASATTTESSNDTPTEAAAESTAQTQTATSS